MSCFKDKIVLITGASSGIGAGTAVAFAKQGAKLILTARNLENLQKTASHCQEVGLPKEKILILVGDVTNDDDVKRIVSEGAARFGGLNVLVNNAGAAFFGNFSQSTVEDLDRMYNINTRSVFTVTKAALPYLEKSKGNIVNVTSLSGLRPDPIVFAYAMAKSAVNLFTQMLAVELGPKGVRVNAIAPGVISTEIFGKVGPNLPDLKEFPEVLDSIATMHPLGRIGDVEEVAQTILFLASDAAPFITGAVLPIDGGRQATVSVPDALK